MKKFSPDQLRVVLLIGAVILGITVIRMIRGY
jgi:hypothetical protein